MLINKLKGLLGLNHHLRLQEDESRMFRKEPYRYSKAHTKGRLKYVQTITTGPPSMRAKRQPRQ